MSREYKIERAKDFINRHLEINKPIPIIVVVDEDILAEVREKFKKELKKLAAIGMIELYSSGEARRYKAFEICSDEGYKKLNEIVIKSSYKLDIR